MTAMSLNGASLPKPESSAGVCLVRAFATEGGGKGVFSEVPLSSAAFDGAWPDGITVDGGGWPED